MSAPSRLVAFAVGCAVLFATALGVGRAVGPVVADPVAQDSMGSMGSMGSMDDAGGHDGHDVGGLEASADGFTLHLLSDGAAAALGELRFQILDAEGESVTQYDEQHEKLLHLVVVRRDLTGFQHVHPELDADGLWSVPVVVGAGAWRVIADFQPAGGEPLVLGADLLVPGEFAPLPLGDDSASAQVDGYDVTLGRELVGAGEDNVLTLTLTRGGQPVTDLQPYLGAYGHLIALREGDLGYLHVHADEDSGPGPSIAFHTSFPSAGRYRLFLDFRHADAVHTASFTVTVEGGGHDH